VYPDGKCGPCAGFGTHRDLLAAAGVSHQPVRGSEQSVSALVVTNPPFDVDRFPELRHACFKLAPNLTTFSFPIIW
jgi:hypothetical protein